MLPHILVIVRAWWGICVRDVRAIVCVCLYMYVYVGWGFRTHGILRCFQLSFRRDSARVLSAAKTNAPCRRHNQYHFNILDIARLGLEPTDLPTVRRTNWRADHYATSAVLITCTSSHISVSLFCLFFSHVQCVHFLTWIALCLRKWILSSVRISSSSSKRLFKRSSRE